METLSCRSKDNVSVGSKPRVYFTCHPTDFDRSFRRLCDEIFRSHDCAIYYTKDMTAQLPEETRETDLERMNLFVVPVSRRLLTEPNRAMDQDVPFALQHHIPLLPIMLEDGLLELYSSANRFGELQYLDPNVHDMTAVSYEDKMRKHLDATLLSDATARRIRESFDAYLFLSYRKKDRSHANDLMRLVHAQPRLRDLAIWYDEFLTPGESFRESIEKALEECRAFLLLVTPNLLEEPGDKPNFVMAEEYPAARNADIAIVPVEMLPTNHASLQRKFAKLPACTQGDDAKGLADRICKELKDVDSLGRNNDAYHTYLMGLAYLNGIDVEIDRARAVHLIESAADTGLYRAMRKLKEMYENGDGVQRDYRKSLLWQKRIVDEYTRSHSTSGNMYWDEQLNLANCHARLGEYQKSIDILEELLVLSVTQSSFGAALRLDVLMSLANSYEGIGNYRKAIDTNKILYETCLETFGMQHNRTLWAMNNLAITLHLAGELEEALDLNEQLLELRTTMLGEEHPETLGTMGEIALSYSSLGESRKALPLLRKAVSLSERRLGEEDPRTIALLNNLAGCLDDLGEMAEATSLKERVYQLNKREFGERHPETIKAMSNLATDHMRYGRYQQANDLYQQAYALRCEVLGPRHPDTIRTLSYLGSSYAMLGDATSAMLHCSKAHQQCREVLGENHPDTRRCANLLEQVTPRSFLGLGDLSVLQDDFWKQRRAYEELRETLGDVHPRTLEALENLAEAYGSKGKLDKELELRERAYETLRDAEGDEAPRALAALTALAQICDECGDYGRALMLMQREYAIKCRLYGEEDPDTMFALVDLALTFGEQGNAPKELELLTKAYAQQRRTLGENDPDTLDTLHEIESLETEHPELFDGPFDPDDLPDYNERETQDVQNQGNEHQKLVTRLRRFFGR